MEAPCKHQHLHFENGGLHIVCANCGYAWVAVGKNPIRILQDVMARAMGLSELDKRSDPYAPPLIRKTEVPKKKAVRNLKDASSKAFWSAVKEDAAAVRELPEWQRAGVSADPMKPVVFLPASERRLIAEVGKKSPKSSKKSS